MRRTDMMVLGLLAVAGTPAAGAAQEDQLTVWRDPAFRRDFLGSYGVRAEVEPSVTLLEKEQMEKILAVMSAPDGLARAALMLARAIKPANSAVFDFTLAGFYFQQDNVDGAVTWYRSAVTKHPSFLRAHKNLGQTLVKKGVFAEAIEPLTRAIALGAEDGMTYGLLGFAYLMTENFPSAESAYRRAMMLQSGVVDWKLGLARCLFKQQNHGEAAALCDGLIAGDADNADFWLLQANAYLGMKQPMKAAANYEYLRMSGRATVASLTTLGDIYINEGLSDLAAGAYREAMALARGEGPERFLRSIEAVVARGTPEDAEALIGDFGKLFAENVKPEDRKRLLKLQARLASARPGADGAHARILEEIVALDPLDGEALILLGQHYGNAGNVEKAIFLFERAAGMEKHAATAALRHAQCLVRHQRYTEAIPLLKRVQEIRPRDDVAKYLEQIERVARMSQN